MTWLVDLQPSGLFTVANAVGRVLFDGAFRTELPWSTKARTAEQIAKVPEMLDAIRWAKDTLDVSVAIGQPASDTAAVIDRLNAILKASESE